MSSLGSPSLAIERSARSQFAVVATVIAIVALVPICIPQLSPFARVFCAIVATGLVCIDFWRVGWLGGERQINRAIWTSEGQWRLIDQANVALTARLSPASQLIGTVIWLRFASDRGPRALLFWGSDLPVDLRRRLTARLRVQAVNPEPEDARAEID